MTTSTNVLPRLNLARSAAEAAVALLPGSQSLRVGEPVSGIPDANLAGQAVTARFTGAATGELVILVDQDLATALEESPLGALDLPAAVRAAMEAAAGAFGTVVVEPGQKMEPAVAFGALATKPDAVLVPLLDGDEMHAAVAVLLKPWPDERPALSVPAQAVKPASPNPTRGLDLLHDVEMDVSAELGRTRMSVRELLSLSPGAVVELDRAAGSPTDLLVNGRLIARGEVVVIDENFGIRVTEILASGGERG